MYVSLWLSWHSDNYPKIKKYKKKDPEASISMAQPDISLIKFQYGRNEKELRP